MEGGGESFTLLSCESVCVLYCMCVAVVVFLFTSIRSISRGNKSEKERAETEEQAGKDQE